MCKGDEIKCQQAEYCLISLTSVSPSKNSYLIASFYIMLSVQGSKNQHEFSICLSYVFASISP